MGHVIDSKRVSAVKGRTIPHENGPAKDRDEVDHREEIRTLCDLVPDHQDPGAAEIPKDIVLLCLHHGGDGPYQSGTFIIVTLSPSALRRSPTSPMLPSTTCRHSEKK
ncbi:hypothetical protein ACEN2S_11710 [Phaeovulum sp. W22_SRMD_FR3]